MKKSVKVAFIIFNSILFLSNYVLVVYLPQVLLFGWFPSQLAFFVVSTVVASIVWGLYFNRFYDTQEHVNAMYKNK